MAFALTRSLGGLQRLANQTALPGVVFASLVQPASITSLLAWHTKHITDHRKLYSSEDKQQQPQQAAHGQAESNNDSSTSKSQQPGPASATGEPTKTLLQDPVDLFAFVTQPWRSFLNNLTVMTIKKRVETSFEEEDFLEGAKDAWFAVSTCMNHKDYEKLAPMCTPGLMSMLKDVMSEQKDKDFEGQQFEVQYASIAGATFLSPATPATTTGQPGSAAIAAPPASSEAQPGQYKDWVMKNMTRAVAGASLGIWVRFSGCLSKQLVKDKSGNVMQEIEDRRSSTWFFVRGPLPDNLPVRELDVPWQVMGFD